MSLYVSCAEKEYTDEEKAKMRRQAEVRALKELTKENREVLKYTRENRGSSHHIIIVINIIIFLKLNCNVRILIWVYRSRCVPTNSFTQKCPH